MGPTASDQSWGITRRGFLLQVGIVPASGCIGYEYVPGGRGEELDDGQDGSTQQRIIERYEDGQRLRNVASEKWHHASDSWERRYYEPAARAFAKAGQYFDDAEQQFRTARDVSVDAELSDAASTCEGARRYCESMENAAVSYSNAANSYASGDFADGDRHLDRGWSQYSTAIEHDIPPSSELRNELGG